MKKPSERIDEILSDLKNAQPNPMDDEISYAVYCANMKARAVIQYLDESVEEEEKYCCTWNGEKGLHHSNCPNRLGDQPPKEEKETASECECADKCIACSKEGLTHCIHQCEMKETASKCPSDCSHAHLENGTPAGCDSDCHTETPEESVEEKYQELLMAVGNKYEGETRHL